ncbi:hypothetical protein ACWDLG_40495 [Nonomuraea sp. NPDC003727]
MLQSLRDTAFHLLKERHALSGHTDGSVPFFRTVAASPALVARAREIASDLQRTCAGELEHDPAFDGPCSPPSSPPRWWRTPGA